VVGAYQGIVAAARRGTVAAQRATLVAFTRAFRDAIAFGILIAILLFRPAGLLGKLKVEKV
jgi:branched-chain amino acid transport system permease protein